MLPAGSHRLRLHSINVCHLSAKTKMFPLRGASITLFLSRIQIHETCMHRDELKNCSVQKKMMQTAYI